MLNRGAAATVPMADVLCDEPLAAGTKKAARPKTSGQIVVRSGDGSAVLIFLLVHRRRGRFGSWSGGFLRLGRRSEFFRRHWGSIALEHLRQDIDALGLEIGLLGTARNVDLDGYCDLRMQRDLDVVNADRLDRPIEHNLTL